MIFQERRSTKYQETVFFLPSPNLCAKVIVSSASVSARVLGGSTDLQDGDHARRATSTIKQNAVAINTI
jgi:hypothetical protein